MLPSLDQRIADAEARLHALVTGRVAEEVEVDGHRTKFSRMTATELRAAIAALRAERDGLVAGGAPARGAIGIVF